MYILVQICVTINNLINLKIKMVYRKDFATIYPQNCFFFLSRLATKNTPTDKVVGIILKMPLSTRVLSTLFS